MGENNQLRDLVLETVPNQHHDELCESMKNLGPERTFFTKVFYLWTEKQRLLAMQEIFDQKHLGGKYKTILFDCLKVNETIKKYESHKRYIEKSFLRFRHCFEHLEEDQIMRHDNSKVSSLLELVGYTARWEWGLDCSLWREALDHHYKVLSLSSMIIIMIIIILEQSPSSSTLSWTTHGAKIPRGKCRGYDRYILQFFEFGDFSEKLFQRVSGRENWEGLRM